MSRGRHIATKAHTGRSKWLVLGLVLGLFLAMAIPAGAGGSQEKATGGVYLDGGDANIRYSEFAVFEETDTKGVKGTYYWSRSDKGEFYGTLTEVDVGPVTGWAKFWGTTHSSSNTAWVPNGCLFSVEVWDIATPGADGDTYHFTWEADCGPLSAGGNRLYLVNGGNLVVHN